MTDRSRFVDWLIKNNKLETYTLMVEVWYNSASLEDNKATAEYGIKTLEHQYRTHRYDIASKLIR